MKKNIKSESKKDYRIILNFEHPRTKITYGVGEPVPADLSETELQDFIFKGNIAEVDPISHENIDAVHKTPDGKVLLSDSEIMSLKPCLRTLNFLKKHKLCADSLKRLKTVYDEMASQYKIFNNYFTSEIYKILDEELRAVENGSHI